MFYVISFALSVFICIRKSIERRYALRSAQVPIYICKCSKKIFLILSLVTVVYSLTNFVSHKQLEVMWNRTDHIVRFAFVSEDRVPKVFLAFALFFKFIE